MKNSWAISAELARKFQPILRFDRMEIDNPAPCHHVRLRYLDRIGTVISILKKHFPDAAATRIGDFGCAQGNTGLLLAEAGYEVFGTDRNPLFVEYSRWKYEKSEKSEKGKMHWAVGEIESLPFPPDFLDAAILGEILTTVAHPDRIVKKVLELLRPGGLLLITVPNAFRLRVRLPTFRQARSQGNLEALRSDCPAGDHLFKLLPEELRQIVPRQAGLERSAYCGGTLLINPYSQWLVRPFPFSWVQALLRLLARLPLLNRKTFHNRCFVFRKR